MKVLQVAEEKKKEAVKKKEPSKTFKEKVISEIRGFGGALIVYFFVTTFFVQNFNIPTGSMEVTLMPGDFIFANKFIYGSQTPYNIPFTDIKLPRYRFPAYREPSQSDVVVFKFPHPELIKSQEGLEYIKRCVAVGGQTLEVRDKQLYVDGINFNVKYFIPGIHISPYQSSDGQVFPRNMGTPDNFGPIRIPKQGDSIALVKKNMEFLTYLALRDGKKIEQKSDAYYVDGVKSDHYLVGQDYFFMMGDNRENSLDSRFWGPVPRSFIEGEGMFIYFCNTDAAKQNNLILKVLSMANLFAVKWDRIGTIIR